MIRRAAEMRVTTAQDFKGGKGTLTQHQILEIEDLHGSGRMFALSTLPPGASIGKHQHAGDFEAYYILSGKGTYDDNGTMTEVSAGDVTLCNDGESHSLENTGAEDLTYLAVINYTPKA